MMCKVLYFCYNRHQNFSDLLEVLTHRYSSSPKLHSINEAKDFVKTWKEEECCDNQKILSSECMVDIFFYCHGIIELVKSC